MIHCTEIQYLWIDWNLFLAFVPTHVPQLVFIRDIISINIESNGTFNGKALSVTIIARRDDYKWNWILWNLSRACDGDPKPLHTLYVVCRAFDIGTNKLIIRKLEIRNRNISLSRFMHEKCPSERIRIPGNWDPSTDRVKLAVNSTESGRVDSHRATDKWI